MSEVGGRDAVSELVRIAEQVRPWLPGDRGRVLDDVVGRAQAGRVRVLVLGEAKRGKSTLVNSLFERDLLPTGVLPVTAVGLSRLVLGVHWPSDVVAGWVFAAVVLVLARRFCPMRTVRR